MFDHESNRFPVGSEAKCHILEKSHSIKISKEKPKAVFRLTNSQGFCIFALSFFHAKIELRYEFQSIDNYFTD